MDARDRNARFTIDSATGHIRVGKVLGADAGEREDEDSTGLAGSPALPDDEDADEAGNNRYVLRVMVSDPSTASATVNVIVTVADVNEPPRFVDEDPPTLLRVRENADRRIIPFGDGDTPVVAGTYARGRPGCRLGRRRVRVLPPTTTDPTRTPCRAPTGMSCTSTMLTS